MVNRVKFRKELLWDISIVKMVNFHQLYFYYMLKFATLILGSSIPNFVFFNQDPVKWPEGIDDCFKVRALIYSIMLCYLIF